MSILSESGCSKSWSQVSPESASIKISISSVLLATMTERRSPRKGIPLLSLKLSTPTVPQLAQSTFSPPTEAAWFGNVGAKRYFLGTRDAEGLSDEDLYNLFLQKESELFAAKNSQTPFQYTQSSDVRLSAFSLFLFAIFMKIVYNTCYQVPLLID